jgi:hypothetical protein
MGVAEAPRDGEAGGVRLVGVLLRVGAKAPRDGDAGGARRSNRLAEEGEDAEKRWDGEKLQWVGSVSRREGRGARRLEADPRNGGKKTDQILVLEHVWIIWTKISLTKISL